MNAFIFAISALSLFVSLVTAQNDTVAPETPTVTADSASVTPDILCRLGSDPCGPRNCCPGIDMYCAEPTQGLCCIVGWVVADGKCCPHGAVDAQGHCCPTGQVNTDGICCPTGNVNCGGKCCNGICRSLPVPLDETPQPSTTPQVRRRADAVPDYCIRLPSGEIWCPPPRFVCVPRATTLT